LHGKEMIISKQPMWYKNYMNHCRYKLTLISYSSM